MVLFLRIGLANEVVVGTECDKKVVEIGLQTPSMS